MTHHLAFVQYEAPAEIALVVVAMFAILILGALWIIVTFFGGIFRRIPFVGSPIANVFDAAARGLRSAISGTLHGTLWAVSKLNRSMVAFVRNTVDVIRNTADAMGGALEHQANVVLPREITGAKAFAQHMANLALTTALDYAKSVGQDATRQITKLKADIQARLSKLQQDINKTIDVVATRLVQLIDQAKADARAADNKLQQRTDQLFKQAEADLAAGDIAAVAKAIATSLADVDKEARVAIAPVWTGIESQLGNLEHVIGSDFPELLRMLQAIPTQAPADLAIALSVITSFLPPLVKVTADCTIPTCRDLGPLRNLLHQLASDAWMAALLAWLIFCVADPQAAAADTVAVTDPLVSTVMQPLIDLIGA